MLLALFLFASLVSFGVFIYGIVHIAQTADQNGANKVLWIVLSILLGSIPIIIYCIAYSKNMKLLLSIIVFVYIIPFTLLISGVMGSVASY